MSENNATVTPVPTWAEVTGSEPGVMGLSVREVSPVMQALADVLCGREGFDTDDVRERLRAFTGTHAETHYLDTFLDPAVDNLAYALGYETAYPDTED